MFELTGFQRDLLYVVAGLDGENGLSIQEELEQYYSHDLNHGRLYPNLDTLVEEGYIEKTELDGRSYGFSLTEKGEMLIENRQQWEGQYTQ